MHTELKDKLIEKLREGLKIHGITIFYYAKLDQYRFGVKTEAYRYRSFKHLIRFTKTKVIVEKNKRHFLSKDITVDNIDEILLDSVLRVTISSLRENHEKSLDRIQKMEKELRIKKESTEGLKEVIDNLTGTRESYITNYINNKMGFQERQEGIGLILFGEKSNKIGSDPKKTYLPQYRLEALLRKGLLDPNDKIEKGPDDFELLDFMRKNKGFIIEGSFSYKEGLLINGIKLNNKDVTVDKVAAVT